MTNLFTLTGFTADFLSILVLIKKEVKMDALLFIGAVGFVQE